MAVAVELVEVVVADAIDGAFEATPELQGGGLAVRALRRIHKSPIINFITTLNP
jgi:hypothetical protein